nr:unnamed protein product [Digitaria exilis]
MLRGPRRWRNRRRWRTPVVGVRAAAARPPWLRGKAATARICAVFPCLVKVKKMGDRTNPLATPTSFHVTTPSASFLFRASAGFFLPGHSAAGEPPHPASPAACLISSPPLIPMSSATAILAAARSPAATLLRLRRCGPVAVSLRAGHGYRGIAMAAAAADAPAPADPLPKVRTPRRRTRACSSPARRSFLLPVAFFPTPDPSPPVGSDGRRRLTLTNSPQTPPEAPSPPPPPLSLPPPPPAGDPPGAPSTAGHGGKPPTPRPENPNPQIPKPKPPNPPSTEKKILGDL